MSGQSSILRNQLLEMAKGAVESSTTQPEEPSIESKATPEKKEAAVVVKDIVEVKKPVHKKKDIKDAKYSQRMRSCDYEELKRISEKENLSMSDVHDWMVEFFIKSYKAGKFE